MIENGKILQENMKKTRLTMDELTEHLRERSISDLSTVKFAILETNGQISALLYPEYQPPTAKDISIAPEDTLEIPVTLISEGMLLLPNLKAANKTKKWVMYELKKRNCSVPQVYLFTLTPSGKINFIRKDERT